MPAYITGVGACLPNEPIDNDRIEAVLGAVNGQSSSVKDIILGQNRIRSRHYVLDPATGRQTHTNAQLTAEAVHALAADCGFDLDATEVLTCGTSSPDQLMPSHAAMVHGLLGCPPCEIVSTTGVCCSGIAALKYGYLSVLAGTSANAVVTGSDVASVGFVAQSAHALPLATGPDAGTDPYAAFDREFLRWMLSDGAGAVLVEGRPRDGSVSLRIDWLDLVSFANELEACMYWGAVKAADGSLRTWREVANVGTAWMDGYFHLAQDVRLLRDVVLPVAMRRSFAMVRAKRGLTPDAVDWLLPHLSSYFFQQPIYDTLVEVGFEVPYERWFTNLDRKGNTGAASMFIMLEELRSSGRLKSGDRLLCVIPESARFSFAYLHLTVV